MRLGSMLALDGFRKSEDGAVAIIFSLSIFVVFLVTGLAIDVGRTYHANSTISSAIDAASLAAAKGLRQNNLSNGEVETLARRMFDVNMAGHGGTYAKVTRFAVRVNRGQSSVQIDVDAEVPTIFGQIAGIEKISFPGSAVAIMSSKDIEVGVQLDVTGSMGGSKIVDLKNATKSMVDILIPDAPGDQKVRVGFAPYAAGVNAGTFARAVAGNRAAAGDCLYERLNTSVQASDMFPSGTSALKTRADLPSEQACPPSAIVLPLTDDKAQLKATVDRFTPNGTTAGHLGTAWAWYLISPRWQTIWNTATPIAPYNDGKTIKVAVLMTDGEYNTVGGVMSGGNQTISSGYAVDTCAAMKAEGVIVYTVGFKLGGVASAISTLSRCASNSSNFFKAESGEELQSAFRAIAEDITNLRLSK